MDMWARLVLAATATQNNTTADKSLTPLLLYICPRLWLSPSLTMFALRWRSAQISHHQNVQQHQMLCFQSPRTHLISWLKCTCLFMLNSIFYALHAVLALYSSNHHDSCAHWTVLYSLWLPELKAARNGRMSVPSTWYGPCDGTVQCRLKAVTG